MRLIKARVKGYRSIIDSGWFDVEKGKTILVGPNESGKTAILQALQQLNPPDEIKLFDPLRDYPRSKYDVDIVKEGINPSEFTFVEGWFSLDEKERDLLPDNYKSAIYVFGRYLNNTSWHRLENVPSQLTFGDIDKDILRISVHFQETASKVAMNPEEKEKLINNLKVKFESTVAGLDKNSIITTTLSEKLNNWLKENIKYLDENNEKENARYDNIQRLLQIPHDRNSVLQTCRKFLPKFILFSNYFRIRPSLHLGKLANRIQTNALDDDQYDYGNNCLLKFLGFTAKDLSDAGNTAEFNLSSPDQYEKHKAKLDKRDYRLNAATIRLTDAIREVWNPTLSNNDANKLRIKADGQYLKVVVEDELGVEVELDQRSEGFQWLVSFYVVFFAESADKHKNAILLLDEPGLSLHALKQTEFRETLSKLSDKNQTIYTTHSPFLVGPDELDKVRVIEMVDRKTGTKVHTSITATDKGAILPLQEALGYDLAQSLFFHKKNLVLEGLTDMWYLESLSELLCAAKKTSLDDSIALIPAGSASKIVYFATILHAQNLKVAALLDSDASGNLAAKQETLVNSLGSKRILRTKDAYSGKVSTPEIEDILRETLVSIAKKELNWDTANIANQQIDRPIVNIMEDVAGNQFSKYQLAKAFIRWSRKHILADLHPIEIEQAEKLIEIINKALK